MARCFFGFIADMRTADRFLKKQTIIFRIQILTEILNIKLFSFITIKKFSWYNLAVSQDSYFTRTSNISFQFFKYVFGRTNYIGREQARLFFSCK